jgi:dTDP-4-amino-4,6-dideoxygalactose transaminase
MRVFETKFKYDELENIIEVIKNGELGFGKNVKSFENVFSFFSKKDYNTATNSASAAAFMIFAYLKEIYGVCDIYTPSLAFTSPAWAAKHFGHNLIFVEVNKNLLFDCEHYFNVRKDSKRKKVLMPILYGGVSTIDNWEVVGDEIIVVDSAHCVTPTIESHFTFFSFHPYKPICSSDGGMISTNLKVADDYFRSYRNFGRINTKDSYNINQEGFKFYMNNLNATIALESIKKYYNNLDIRKETYLDMGYAGLSDLLPHDDYSSYYFATRIKEEGANEFNKDSGLQRHYPLLHLTKYYKDGSKLPFTEKIHNKIINLPLWAHL